MQMPLAYWAILIAILSAASIGALVYWSIALLYVLRQTGSIPTARDGLALFDAQNAQNPQQQLVSIVIAAHNEERVIESCVQSVRRQDYTNIEIIFVLDRCTDRTAEILARHAADDDRIRIVTIDAVSEDWSGKGDAVQVGANHAKGEWIVVSDADGMFDLSLVRAAMGLVRHRDLDMLSILAALVIDRRFLRINQPVATMRLIRMFPLERANRGRESRPFASGGFYVIKREWYEKIGGHAAVRAEFQEDVSLVRLVHRSGGKTGLAVADGMLHISMYETPEAFRTGWKRIFIGVTSSRLSRLRKHAWRSLGQGLLVPAVQIGAMAAGIGAMIDGYIVLGAAAVTIAGAGVAMQVIALMRIYKMSGAPMTAVMYYPLGCCRIAGILFAAADDLAHRRIMRWGGKEYTLEPR